MLVFAEVYVVVVVVVEQTICLGFLYRWGNVIRVATVTR